MEIKIDSKRFDEMVEELNTLRAQIKAARDQDPVAWISTKMCLGAEYGKEIYGKLPVQSLQAGYYKHTPLYAAPVPADNPARITEQDVRDIATSYCHWKSEGFYNAWFSEKGRALLNKLNADREQVPAVATPEGWREALTEMVQAMRQYEMDVDGQAPEKHRVMMDRAETLLAAPSHSQQIDPAADDDMGGEALAATQIHWVESD